MWTADGGLGVVFNGEIYNFAELREAGFMRLTVPRAHGGAEAPIATYLAVQEALAQGDGSTALGFMMHAKLFGQQRDGPSYPEPWFAEFCRGAVVEGWMANTIATEEGLGSPSGGGVPGTVARASDDGWVIDGRKTFATLAPALRYFIVLARIDGANGALPDLANFVVYPDDPGARVVETWDALGMRATGSHDFVLEGCGVPVDRLLTRRGLREPDPKSEAGTAWFALGLAATVIGVARAAREYAVAFARERTPNSARTIAEYPGVRERVARIDLLLQRSRAEVADAARAWEARDAIAPGEMGALERIAVAKVDTLNSCIEAVDLAMRVVGGVSAKAV